MQLARECVSLRLTKKLFERLGAMPLDVVIETNLLLRIVVTGNSNDEDKSAEISQGSRQSVLRNDDLPIKLRV
ncbi:hypothetical protein [Occallatibacter savannae]|uniref:hypothetical protein n=1 Tax=Occallatibacter savannae TaxID=1002691 RepID=UPI001EF55FA0|nr:hypothetical protein [Occallatibacter savannae]